MDNSLLPTRRSAFYAIQDTNTGHRTWEKEDEERSQLVYDWSAVKASTGQSQDDLLIEVSRTYPDKNHEAVKQLADGIFQSERLQISDRIFAVQDQSIQKIGYIENIDHPKEGMISIDINWVSGSELGEVKGKIFEDIAELQPLRRKEIKKIEHQFKKEIPAIYGQLPPDLEEELVRLSEANFEVNYESLKSVDIILDLPKEDKGGVVTLFYGTNREAISESKTSVEYGMKSGALQYGFCEVSIPKGHVQGELERPGKFFFVELPENEKKHIVMKAIKPFEQESFRAAFTADLKKSPKQHALVFVHGYNNSFEDGARRAAQIAWDLPFEGLAGFFSWPSSGKLPDYLADEAKARSSTPAFQQFLQTILEGTGVEKLHLIAHSMGNLVLTLSVNAIKRDLQMAGLLTAIHQIILAAPDIDQEEFRSIILPDFQGIGTRRTIYASDHDSALGISSFLRRARKRLGQMGEDIFMDLALDTVEASNIRTDDSHSYMFEDQVLLSDIFYLISKDLSPAERRLRKIVSKDLFYWLFPK